MRKLIAFVAVSCCVVFAGSHYANAATLSVDPKNSCFDLTTNKLSGTIPPIPPISLSPMACILRR